MNDEHPNEYDPEKGVTSEPPEPPPSGYPGDYQDPGMSYQGYSLEELAGAEDGGEGEEIYSKPAYLSEMPYWAISALLHLVLMLILVGMVISHKKEEKLSLPVSMRAPPPPIPYDPTKKKAMERKIEIPKPIIPDIPVVKRKIEEPTVDIPKGTDLLNQSNVNMQATFINDAIGMAGGAAGAYGMRHGKGALIREGGSEATESAVRAALEWLYRHQHHDGSWRGKGFTNRCKGGNCGGAANDTDQAIGLTGLAVLAFTGAGHSHRYSSVPHFKTCLQKATKYLMSTQGKGGGAASMGRYGNKPGHKSMYHHSIATMALGELLILSGDVITLKKTVKAGMEYILRARNPGKAWRYGYRDGDNDVSVTGWMILALKTGKISRLGIDKERYEEAFRDSIAYFRGLTNEYGITGYHQKGKEHQPVPCMTSVGVLCRLLAGEKRTAGSIRLGVEQILKQPPVWKKKNPQSPFYYWYYASYALFQYGGTPWKAWNPDMQSALLKSQRNRGCVDGSWDPIVSYSKRGGRVYTTALGAMTLEVYYRFRRTQAGAGFFKQ
ncbi:MAG: prenyltransferase/squalene oxidase repeat-containing protein [Planctomycetota bacterium]|nr:hypothetical protein [Planctomycetota bacterium]MEE3054769.1 prenyltransferase/squalene oxidase repeat-containing protein [Planctomycetota bacterium]